MNTHALIATTAPAPELPPPTPQSIENWGLHGAVLYLILKEGWTFLKKGQDTQSNLMLKKEDNESNLINMLVESLKANQTQLLESQAQLIAQLVAIQKQSHEEIKELKEAVISLGASVREELHESMAQQTEVQIKKSESLILINQKLDTMSQRLNIVEGRTEVMPCRRPKAKALQEEGL